MTDTGIAKLKNIMFKALLALSLIFAIVAIFGVWIDPDSETTARAVGSLSLVGVAALLGVTAIKVRDYLAGRMSGRFPLLKLAAFLFIAYFIVVAMAWVGIIMFSLSSGFGGLL